MEGPNEKKIPEYLQKLIEGCNTYFKAANKFWISMAVFSLIIILSIDSPNETVDIPFSLGKIPKNKFYPLGFTIISLLVICFGSTLSQAIRARQLIQRVLNNYDNQYISKNIYLQDVIDAAIYPSLNRVAPLAQITQGKNQFYPQSEQNPRWKRNLSSIYYIIIKLFAVGILYIFPSFALIESFILGRLYQYSGRIIGVPVVLFWVIGLFTFVILLQLFITELQYSFSALKRIQGKPNQ